MKNRCVDSYSIFNYFLGTGKALRTVIEMMVIKGAHNNVAIRDDDDGKKWEGRVQLYMVRLCNAERAILGYITHVGSPIGRF
jgi:hypothetical protein